MAKKDAVVVRSSETTISSREVPEHLKKYANSGSVGLEQMTADDMIMPRLTVAQSMSPQLLKNDPSYIPQLEAGQFFNTVTKEIYGEGPLLVVPLYAFKSRILFPPRGSDAAILCSTQKVDPDGRLVDGRITPEGCDICPHSKFLETPRADGSNRPDCTMFYNYVLGIPKGNAIEPIALSLKSKMIKTAKQFNSLMRIRQMPAFTMLFNLTSVSEKAPKGTFFNINVNGAGDVDPNLIDQTEKLYSSLSKTKFKIHDVESEEEEEVAVPF